MRHDKRNENEIRQVEILTDYLIYPEGSVLISFGETKVIVNATIEESVPPFLKGSEKGWITAEYSMLPRATNTRNRRESSKGKITGRTMEIQRLIGRSLRAVVDLKKLGERSIIVDCDVIQADGGTRTASITGAFVAMKIAVNKLLTTQVIKENPIKEHLAAISVGILPNGMCVTDLDYVEDSSALVDMNIVMTESGRMVEIQGTGEEATFSKQELNILLERGEQSVNELIHLQKKSLNPITGFKNTKDKTKKEILIATKNKGKAKEFADIFKEKGFTIKTLLDYPEIPDVEENGVTFEENARLKAETIAGLLNTIVLADDSGLSVEALDGQPGVYSARFAGETKNDAANNAKLLAEMHDIPSEKRNAEFHCTLVLASPIKNSLVVEGVLKGKIVTVPKGENGFGYDPLFYIPEISQTFAELSSDEKNKISHRKKAIENLMTDFDAWMEE